MSFSLLWIILITLTILVILTFLTVSYLFWPQKEYTEAEINTELKNLFQVVAKILNENNVEYFLAYGTLLGKCRHDSIIPWDDDFDLAVNERDLSQLQSINWEKYGLKFIAFSNFYKIFWLKNKKISIYPHSWPFIDIFTYRRYSDSILLNGETVCANTDIYPLQEIEFLDTQTFIPANSRNILDQQYGTDWATTCISSHYNHVKEQGKTNYGKIPCRNVKLMC